MKKLFQNKKLVIILSIVLAVVLATGIGMLAWHASDRSNTYTVNFVTNGGGEIEPMIVEKGAVLSQTDLPVPSKYGYLFLTWNTDEALTAPYWNAPIESDMTLYASYLEPSDADTVFTELTNSAIPFAKTDFSVTVVSSIALTKDNIGNYIVLTVNYGAHANGEEIKLSVSPEGNGIYRISANFAEGGEYMITLVSDAVTFNPEDETLLLHGFTEALRSLTIRTQGEAWMEGERSDKVVDIPSQDIELKDSDSITVSGDNQALLGAAEEENSIICIGDGDDISNYYKIVAVESTSADGTTYTVRPAEVDEVYDHVEGYQWYNLDGDDIVINEEAKQELLNTLSNNEQLNNYVKYLALASTETSTFQTLAAQGQGQLTVLSLSDLIVLPGGIEFGLKFDAYNENYKRLGYDDEVCNEFVKLTLGITYEIKIAKLGSVGSVTATVGLKVDFWVFVGVGGYVEVGWGEYDVDFGSTVLTQTEITFEIGLISASGKKYPNIDDEIQAVLNSAQNPTPENLLEQYNELMGGGSQSIELFNQKLFDAFPMSFFGGAVRIGVPVRFVVSLDLDASFTSYFTVLTGDDFGITGNEDDGLDAFHRSLARRYKYRIELKGHVEVRAGVEVGIELGLAYDLATVSLNLQSGFYVDLYGYFYYELNRMDWPYTTSQGGAYYLEFGLYVDVRLRASVCVIKYSGSLWDKKFPLVSSGQKEIVYGFVYPSGDEILMENVGNINIEDTGVLDVYVLDITEERSEDNPRIVENYPFNANKFEVIWSNDNFSISMSGGEIWLEKPPTTMMYEAMLTLKYTGSQMSFRDCITKYVTVRFTAQENVDWDKINTTCTVDFTIDGEIIFSREAAYGSKLKTYGIKGNLSYYLKEDNRIVTDLRSSESEALYDAGYAYVEWAIPDYITEDITLEAVHGIGEIYEIEGPALRRVGYVVQTPVETIRDQSVLYGETPDLSEYESDEYCFDDRMTFDRWSIEPAPLTEDDVVYIATYKPIMVTVSVEVAGTTDADAVYEAKTYSAEINKGGFVNELFEQVPRIGRKTLAFYSDAAYTQHVIGYPQIEGSVTYYARYEDYAHVYFYNQYGQNVLTKRVEFGEGVTLTDEELALFTFCDPAEIESGVRFTYKGLNHSWLAPNEVIELSDLIVDQYSTSVFPVYDKEYKVTFLDVDGSVLAENYYAPGTAIEDVDVVPAKGSDGEENHDFLGWVLESGEAVVDITRPVTLKPKYQDDLTAYTVTFLNYDGSVFATKYLLKGENIANAQAASDYFDLRYNYVFSHWENVDGEALGTTVTGDCTFKPVYEIESDVLYTVSFVGGSGAVTEDGKTLAITEKYKYDELEDAIGAYLDGMVTKKMSGYTYVLDTYTITPNMGGICIVDLEFVEAMAAVTFKIGNGALIYHGRTQEALTVELPINENGFISLEDYSAAKEGTAQYAYTFSGWMADGGTVYTTLMPCTVGDSVTLTAQFGQTVRSYTVTFDGNGGLINGQATQTQTVHYGATPTAPNNPIRTSTETARYEFAGWSPTLTAVTGEVTYTARWNEIRLYTVTFDAGEGQFDSTGKSQITLTVDEGYALASNNIPVNPYKKTDAGYYEFSAWTPAVAAGTVINNNVTYTATYQSEVSTRTGITVSDGVNTEDIAAFLNGTSKISGYTYVLDNEFFGKALTITASGLTLSGEAKDIHIEICDSSITLAGLTLTYTNNGYLCFLGTVEVTVDETVKIISEKESGDAIRGDYSDLSDANITLRGADADSRLIVDSVMYGVAVYGKLTVNNLDMNLTVSPVYEHAAAIQAHDSGENGRGTFTVIDSDIVINEGMVNVARLIMRNSSLEFKDATFTSGAVGGLYIMTYGNYITENDPLIELTASTVSFTHDIAIAIGITTADNKDYYVNTDIERFGITSTYSSPDTFLADVNADGYSGMVIMDQASAIN